LYLVFDARLVLPTVVVWINLVLIFKSLEFKLVFLIILLLSVAYYFFTSFRKELLVTFLLVLLSTLLAFFRIASLSNEQIDNLISQNEVVLIEGVITRDLIHRPNKNPFTNQDRWELSIKSNKVSAGSFVWRVRVPVLIDLNYEHTNLELGSKVRIIGKPTKSYRSDHALMVKAESIKALEDPDKLNMVINIFRENFSSTVQRVDKSAAGLIPGLVSGDTRLQSDEFTLAMRKTGLTHLTAVSGGNIAILLAVFIWFFKVLRSSRKLIFLLSIFLLLIFLILVRFEPSALRATVMGLIAVWTLTFGGPRTSIGALNFSIFFLLLIDPWLAVNWGFILSVFATLGLIVLAPEIQKIWIARAPSTPRLIVLLASLTLSAQLITYPILGIMVGEISLVSILANILAMPTVAWVTVFGFLTLIFSTLLEPAGLIFAYLALPAAMWIEWVALTFSKIPFAQISVSAKSMMVFTICLALAVVWKFVGCGLEI
jgi:competence protein ComEC